MNKVHLIIAEGDLRENGYYILVGGNTKEETKEIIDSLNELVEYVMHNSPWEFYTNAEEIGGDIAYFKTIKSNNIHINKDLMEMLFECKNLNIKWEFKIKTITL